MFWTRYAGVRFDDLNHPAQYLVLGICYGKHHRSQWFKNVELEDVTKFTRKVFNMFYVSSEEEREEREREIRRYMD